MSDPKVLKKAPVGVRVLPVWEMWDEMFLQLQMDLDNFSHGFHIPYLKINTGLLLKQNHTNIFSLHLHRPLFLDHGRHILPSTFQYNAPISQSSIINFETVPSSSLNR